MSAVPYAKLSDAAFLNPTLGGRLPEDDLVSFVPMASLSAETAKIETTQDRPYSEVSKGFTPFLSGDVLVAKITPCFENGKIAQALLPRRNGFGSTEFHVVRARPDVSDARYLHHYLRLDAVRVEGQRRMTGSGGQRRVPASFLSDLHIPLPSLEEQRRIAAILDQAETLRTQRRQALAHLDTLTQSLFLDMFGDMKTILSQWPVKEFGASLEFLTSGSRGWAAYYADAGDLFLRIQNVRRDELSLDEVAYVKAPDTAEARRTLVRPGDVLLSITADLGRTAVVPSDIGAAFINQHLCILRSKAFIPRFLSAYLASPMGQRQVMGRNKHAVKAGLNFDDIRSFQIPHPPLPLQQTFATRIQAIEALKATHRTALAQLDALFASLQQRAFAGQL